MRRCESPDACKWPRCGCIEGLGAIQNAAGRDATQRGKPGSLVDDPSLSAAPDDPVKELADHVAYYADSWPVYEPGYVVSLATSLRKMEKDLREEQWHRQAAVKNMKKAEQQVNELNEVLRQAGWGQGEIDSCYEIIAKAEQRVRKLENALEHQRLALAIVRERQREGDKFHVSVTDLEQGIKQIDAALKKK